MNLLSSCFSDKNYLRERTCRYEWLIDSNTLSGNYYFDVNVTDGNKVGTDSSNNALTVIACTIPYNGILLSADTNLCYGTYSLAGSATGAIQFNASGVAGNPITLDCHRATILGNGASGNYGLYASSKSYLEVKNCAIVNYNAGNMYFGAASHVLLQDVNADNNASIGINFSTAPLADLNFVRVSSNNHAEGLRFWANVSNVNIIDSNFMNNSSYGVNIGGTSIDINFYNVNSSGASTGLYAGALMTRGSFSNCTLSNLGSGIYTQAATSITVRDVNADAVGGNGILFYNSSSDLNLLRVSGNRRTSGLVFWGSGTISKVKVIDSNFIGCAYAIKSGPLLSDLNVCGTNLSGATDYSVYGYAAISKASFCNDTNLLNSANGFYLDSNNTITGFDFAKFNIPGIVLAITGSHNLFQDLNVSKTGTAAGTGMLFSYTSGTIADNNIVRVDFTNRPIAMQLWGAATKTGFKIVDSNFVGNTSYGVYGGLADSNISHNLFKNTAYGINLTISNMKIKSNNFVTNTVNVYTTGIVSDANGNYWSNLSPCPGSGYTFTGGTDYTPVCSQIP